MQPVASGAQPRGLDRSMLGCVYEFLPVKDGAACAGTNKLTNELFKAGRLALEYQEIASACKEGNCLDPSMGTRLDSDMVRKAREIGVIGFNNLLLSLATKVSNHTMRVAGKEGAAQQEAEENSMKASKEKEAFRHDFIWRFCVEHGCSERGQLSKDLWSDLYEALGKAEREKFPGEEYDPQEFFFQSYLAKRVFKLLQSRRIPSAEKMAVLVDLTLDKRFFYGNDNVSYGHGHISRQLTETGRLELAQFVVEQMPEGASKDRYFFPIVMGYVKKDQMTEGEAARVVELINKPITHLMATDREYSEIAQLLAGQGFVQEAVQCLQKIKVDNWIRGNLYADCIEVCLARRDYEGALKVVKDYYSQGVEGDPSFGVKNDGVFGTTQKVKCGFDEGAVQLLHAGKYQQVLEISRLVFINEKVDESTKLFSALEQWAETLATDDGKFQEAINQGAVELLNNIKLGDYWNDLRGVVCALEEALEEKLRGLGQRAALLKAQDVSETSDVDEETPSQRLQHVASSKKAQKLSFSSERGGKSIRYLWSTSWIFRILSVLTGGLLPLVMFFVEGFSKKPLYRKQLIETVV